MPLNISSEAMSEFLAEAQEISQRVSENLGLLEKKQHGPETVTEIYRDTHTLKGTAQLFGFNQIGEIAHAIETSMDPFRNSNRDITSDIVDSLYQCLDLLDQILTAVKTGQSESQFQEKTGTCIHSLIQVLSDFFGNESMIRKDTPPPQLQAAKDEKEQLSSNQDQAAPQAPSQEASKPQPQKTAAEPSQPQAQPQAQPQENSPTSTSRSPADTTVRVHVDLLDTLMNLTGELVLVRNQFLQLANRSDQMELLNLSQNLDIVTSDLQSEVMKTRMQPIGNVLGKYQRVIRDIARDLGKKIDLTLEGTETELDKTLLEAIKDPLTHIVRNSCDHGIETPEERKAAGKPEAGQVNIRAFHEGGQVIVEIIDDGKGLDQERIIAKAIERGILTETEAKQISVRDTFALIFHAGFSTAQKVSSVSGRGVGMDVVKTNIEKIGGTIELDSQKGQGTQLRLRIPLTLAIVPAMIVRLGEEQFAIPQVKLVELVRVERTEENEEQVEIEFLQGKPIFRLRGELLPLVNLDEILGKTSDFSKIKKKIETGETVNIVVLNADGHSFGLIVDEILDKADIVVKPLSQFLKSLNIFSGATIMGDGSVALILDVGGIAQKASINLKGTAKSETKNGEAINRSSDSQEFLVFELNHPGKFGVPLCLVHRLEEFPRKSIELSGNQKVIQYRGSILPIVSLNEILEFDSDSAASNSGSEPEIISVVVAQKQGRLFGVEVNSILDVLLVEHPIDDSLKDRFGIMGNIVLSDEVVAVVDFLSILEEEIVRMSGGVKKTKSEVWTQSEPTSPSTFDRNVKILYAEDAPFFRRQVQKALSQAGISVTTAEDGRAALELLERGDSDQFDLLLSDIEMPRMTGFELAESVRKLDRFKSLPLIALTTRFKNKDIENGKKVGFNLYLEKMNSDELIKGIKNLLSQKGAA